MITNEEKIKILTDKIEQVGMHISWLNLNIGNLEEIPSGKLTMKEQLDNYISGKAALQAALDELI
jgi:hypothetical protein